jgi:hypothetical protein
VRAAVVAEKGRGRKKPKPIAAREAADAAGVATAAVDVLGVSSSLKKKLRGIPRPRGNISKPDLKGCAAGALLGGPV